MPSITEVKIFSVIGVKKNKSPVMPWKGDQSNLPDDERLIAGFTMPDTEGIAIVCGCVSMNLEVIDVDKKNDTKGKLVQRVKLAITTEMPGLFERLHIVKTPTGGAHFYYRCPKIESNQKLAQVYVAEEGVQKKKVIIETRGEGGYVVAPPSIDYIIAVYNDIPIITPEERDVLHSVCRSFDETYDDLYSDEREAVKETLLGTPYQDYNCRGDIVELLQRHGWEMVREDETRIHFRRPGKTMGTSGDYHKEIKLFKVFTNSVPLLKEGKAYKPGQLYGLLECNGDFGAVNIKLRAEGYGSETYSPNREILTFWTVERGSVKPNRPRLMKLLSEVGGFCNYKYEGRMILIKRDGKFVEETNIIEIKQWIKRFINNIPSHLLGEHTHENLFEAVMAAGDTYINKGTLEFLDIQEIQFCKDTQQEGYFAFRNGVVKVNREGAELISYENINKYFWKQNIVDFDISFDEDDYFTSEFNTFLQLALRQNDERYKSAITIIGYLIHKFKDPAVPRAVILLEETEHIGEGGGSGKGVVIQAISKMVDVALIDGKRSNPQNRFAYQRVTPHTDVIALDDCNSDFNFEALFPMITDGFIKEGKYQAETFYGYKESAKWLLTTNYTIRRFTGSDIRRQAPLEFSSYFNHSYTIKDEFGHRLFEDWDVKEWNKFYLFMFECLKRFLQVGLIIIELGDNINRKKIRQNFGEEFFNMVGLLFRGPSRSVGPLRGAL